MSKSRYKCYRACQSSDMYAHEIAVISRDRCNPCTHCMDDSRYGRWAFT